MAQTPVGLIISPGETGTCRRRRKARAARRLGPQAKVSPAAEVLILRKIAARAAVRQRDERLTAGQRDFLNLIDRQIILSRGNGRMRVVWLAEQLHCSVRMIHYYQARCEALGYLVVLERANADGGPACNGYRVRSPRDARNAAACAARAAARAERDRIRKEPRSTRYARHQAESPGWVLQWVAPPLTRERVNVPSERVRVCQSPPVPGVRAAEAGGGAEVRVMAEGFGELGPGWGGRTGDGGATPGQGWPGAGPSDWVPPLTDAQIEAARARGLPIRLEDVIEARIKGRIAPGDEGLTNEEIARYNARAALAWEKGERAGPAPPRQRPRPRWRR